MSNAALVVSHNGVLANRFASSRGAYAAALQEAVTELRGELAKLTPPSADDIKEESDCDDDDDD